MYEEFHKYILDQKDIHLGVADKYLINNFFSEYDKKLNLDINRTIIKFLDSMGYKSKKLEQLITNL